jgi:hypothetical protein
VIGAAEVREQLGLVKRAPKSCERFSPL